MYSIVDIQSELDYRRERIRSGVAPTRPVERIRRPRLLRRRVAPRPVE